jgi:hypothetical protein
VNEKSRAPGGGTAQVDAELAKRMNEDGFAVLGRLDPALHTKLLRTTEAVGEAQRDDFSELGLHLLSCFHANTDLMDIVDWPPLLATIVQLLSPNVYMHHSHLDIHPPIEATPGHRWHRDGGVQGREMGLMPIDQPRLSVKAAVFLTDVLEPDDGAMELVPGSHRDATSRRTEVGPDEGVSLTVPAGTVALFDARVWHRRRDNIGQNTRKALFFAYTYRWISTREEPSEHLPGWHDLPPVRRQLFGDRTWDAFYPVPGELPLEQWAGDPELSEIDS